MRIEAELVKFLKADEAVKALVADRVYPVMAPEDVDAPYIVYRRMGTARAETMAGAGTPDPRFRLKCWANDYEQAIQLADAVRARMDGKPGDWGDIHVQRVKLEDESDVFDVFEWDADDGAFGRQLDFTITHNE